MTDLICSKRLSRTHVCFGDGLESDSLCFPGRRREENPSWERKKDAGCQRFNPSKLQASSWRSTYSASSRPQDDVGISAQLEPKVKGRPRGLLDFGATVSDIKLPCCLAPKWRCINIRGFHQVSPLDLSLCRSFHLRRLSTYTPCPK